MCALFRIGRGVTDGRETSKQVALKHGKKLIQGMTSFDFSGVININIYV